LIPLPPLPEQQRIAAILQKANRLRQLRRYARQLSDGYLQSVFLEMFDEEREEYRKEFLGDIAEIASGITKGQNFNGRKTIEVPYLRVANVQDGYLNLTEKKNQPLPSDMINLQLKIGDILMTEGGDYDKLGRGTKWQERCAAMFPLFWGYF
jgi:type I restriction enzyme S subunit